MLWEKKGGGSSRLCTKGNSLASRAFVCTTDPFRVFGGDSGGGEEPISSPSRFQTGAPRKCRDANLVRPSLPGSTVIYLFLSGGGGGMIQRRRRRRSGASASP